MDNKRAIELLKIAIGKWCDSCDSEYSCSHDGNCHNCIKDNFRLTDNEMKELEFQ